MAKELLTDVAIRNAKPADKAKRLNDGGGLYLLLQPNGAKWWRLDYSINGNRKTLSLGVYPATSLAIARTKAKTAQEQISQNIDPSDTRKTQKAERAKAKENAKRIDAGLPVIDSFEHIAREWHENHKDQWSTSHETRAISLLQRDLFPRMGATPINALKQPNYSKP